MKTRFFNVGHGDTILIELEKSNLQKHYILRDYGASSCNKNNMGFIAIDTVFNKHLLPLLSSKSTFDVYLSHPHQDHFNGFLYLFNNNPAKKTNKKYFSKAIIPMIDFSTRNSMGALLVKQTLMEHIFSIKGIKSSFQENSKNWLLAAPVLYGLSGGNLYCVDKGYTQIIGNYQINTLWPFIPEGDYNEFYTYEESSIILSFFSEDQLFQLNNYAEKIIRILAAYYNAEKTVFSIDDCQSDIEELTRQISLAEDIANRINDKKEFNSQELINKVSTNLDNFSLNFEILDNNANKKFLFLSDAYDPTVNKMLVMNNLNNIAYDFIKSSHHGTRAAGALNKNGITSKKIIHCCGGTNNPSWTGPISKYEQIAPKGNIALSWDYTRTPPQKPWHKWSNLTINSGDYLDIP